MVNGCLPSVVVSRTAQAAQLALLKSLSGNLNSSSYYPIAIKVHSFYAKAVYRAAYSWPLRSQESAAQYTTYFNRNSITNICSLGLKNITSSILRSLGQEWGAR